MENIKLIDVFIDHTCSSRSLSENTKKAYRNDLKQFSAFVTGKNALIEVSAEDIIAYLINMESMLNLKKTTVKRRIATLKQFMRWLNESGIIHDNPLAKLRVTVRIPHSLPKSLPKRDIAALLSTQVTENSGLNYKDCLLLFAFNLLFVSGVRVGELVNMRIQDLCIEESHILIRGKGNRERKAYLSGTKIKKDLHGIFQIRKSIGIRSEYLFVFEDGRRVSSQYIRRHLKKKAQHSGLNKNITPHMLRHSVATQLIESGVDMRFVQKMLGHASIQTTQIYTQVSDSSLKSVLERADLLGRLEDGVKDN